MSSNGSRALIVIVIIILLIVGVWYAIKDQAPVSETLNEPAAVANVSTAVEPAVNANSSIEEDIANIEAELSAMGKDAQSIDAGLNDKPIAE